MLINDFLANREVLVTGGTGYLGKALVEKLLRDSPKLKVIYLLLRSKKSQTPGERLEQFKQDQVFDEIHKQCPKVLEKLYLIQGNSSELGLGIQPTDLKLLQNVSIVFHMAANVKFDDPLRSSILLNTRGTHELVKIAETLKNLVAFVHCSTAYCNPFEEIVEERTYKMPVDWRQVIKIAETCDENTLNVLFKKFTDHYPNTYTFTKNLSEQLIKEYSTKLPMSLFRPSIVMNAFDEPSPGWIDNLNGPIAAMVAMSAGLLPISHSKPSATMDALPIDLVTKLTIVAAYKRGMQYIRREPIPDGLEVINCTSGDIYKMDLHSKSVMYDIASRKNPLENKIWDFELPLLTGCYYKFIIQIFCFAIPLSNVVDWVSVFAGQKPMMMQMLRRAVYATKSTSFFGTREYIMKNENMINLEDVIPPSDIPKYGVRAQFNPDVFHYMNNVTRGVKHYILKQPREATPAALKRAKILIVITRSIQYLIISLCIIYLWSIVKKIG